MELLSSLGSGKEEGVKARGVEGVEEEDEEVLIELEQVAKVALHDPDAVNEVEEDRRHALLAHWHAMTSHEANNRFVRPCKSTIKRMKGLE